MSGVPASETEKAGLLTILGSTCGLAFGPSTILVLTFGSFVAPLQHEFGWSRPQILSAVAIVSVMIVLVAPVQGYLIDRFGARRVVLWSALAFAAGLACMMWLPGRLDAFYAAFAILSVLAVGLWPGGYLRAVSTWFDRRLGLALGIANSGIGIGAAILPLVAALVMADHGWRAAYACFGVLVALTIPLNLLVLRERVPARRAAPTGSAPDDPDFGEVRRTAAFRTLVIAYFAVGFASTGTIVNQIPMLIDGGASPARAALVESAFGIAVIAGRLIVGALLDYGRPSLIMAATCCGAILAYGIYATGTIGWPAFIGAALLGLVLGAEFDVAAFLVKRLFGVRAFGRTYGFLYGTFQLASAIGTPVLGLSQVHAGGYAPGLILYATCLAVAALCFLLLGRLRATRGLQPAAVGGSSLPI